ncbi:MAG: hypothetical protein LBC96_06690 [Lachnospiraceae bacterium]|jgi:hypothetical protein|nr:hypothetical protein [Lachnospiraceae bacterium]
MTRFTVILQHKGFRKAKSVCSHCEEQSDEAIHMYRNTQPCVPRRMTRFTVILQHKELCKAKFVCSHCEEQSDEAIHMYRHCGLDPQSPCEDTYEKIYQTKTK